VLFALALSSACKSTPLDVVYSADVTDAGGAATIPGAGAGGVGVGAGAGAGAGGAGNAGAAADAGPCSKVGPGSYVLRSQANGLCLGQGAPTTVFGNPGFLLNFSADCRRSERTWQLRSTPTPNVFSIQNLSSPVSVPAFVLDVQMAGTRDGTPVITYGDTGFDNQRFEVRARDAFTSELRPQHHPQSCVSAAAGSAEIAPCTEADSRQAWQLQQSDCL
jgi:hypothetical protein